MIQFLTDIIDQLDLALDQLAFRDRNFDRFALMLIDNVVELTLHQFAEQKEVEQTMMRDSSRAIDSKLIANALAQRFDAKVSLAKATGMLPDAVCEAIMHLHSFRNTAYHKGQRHERILHSLALLYFDHACTVLTAFSPKWWGWSSEDQISHRAMKYVGHAGIGSAQKLFPAAYERLREVAASMKRNLVQDLASDMESTIDTSDREIRFLAEDAPTPGTRKQAVIDCQTWATLFTEEGQRFRAEHQCPETTVGGVATWLAANFPWPIRDDPVPGWKRRLKALRAETDENLALKKYFDFMRQTEDIREKINRSAGHLEVHIQQQIDLRRGK